MGTNTHLWEDLAQGSWATPEGEEPTPLDLTMIKDVQFQISTNTTSAVDFDFCITNLTIDGYVAPEGTGGASGSGGAEGTGGEAATGGAATGGAATGGEGS